MKVQPIVFAWNWNVFKQDNSFKFCLQNLDCIPNIAYMYLKIAFNLLFNAFISKLIQKQTIQLEIPVRVQTCA